MRSGWIAVVLFMLSQAAAAREGVFSLFDQQRAPHPAYVEMLEKLKEVDLQRSVSPDQPDKFVVSFSRGEQIIITEWLGEGNTTVVFATDFEQALRLAKGIGRVENIYGNSTYQWFLESFHAAAKELESLDMPAVKVYSSADVASEYILTERLAFDNGFKFADFPEMLHRQPDHPTVVQARSDLLGFMRQVAPLIAVGDLSADNLWWFPGRGWLMVDFTVPVVKFADLPQTSLRAHVLRGNNDIVEVFVNLPYDLQEEIDRITELSRETPFQRFYRNQCANLSVLLGV